MRDIFKVTLSKQVLKNLRKIPLYVALKLQAWVESVGTEGLRTTSKYPGYRNESLKGQRRGQYSIRLSKYYRVFYVIEKNVVKIIEVNKHDY